MNGTTKTLETGGFVSVRGKELWPGAQNLVEGPKDTSCYSVKEGTLVQLRRATAADAKSKSMALLLKVDDLVRCAALRGL